MNKNIVIVLAGGFIIAILVAVMVQAGLSGKKEKPRDIQAEILVAARELRVGTELSAADVRWQEWPEHMVFTGAIRRAGQQAAHEALTGRLRERVSPGQPIQRSMLASASRGNMLAASLQDGYRAVGVEIRTESLAGGLIGIGDYVDVVLTHTLSRTGNTDIVRRYASETILENVRVLGIDNRSIVQEQTQDANKRAKTRQTVTLEVDPHNAEKIALASTMGDITLTLRPLGDEAEISGAKATTDVGLSRIISQTMGGGGGRVRIYNGAQMDYVSAGGRPVDTIMEENDDVVPDLPHYNNKAEDVMPSDVLDAVREGISEGISRGLSEGVE